MRFIICLDDKNGMLFNNRRQSRDKVVLEDIFNDLKSEELCITSFSEKLFSDYQSQIQIVDTPLTGGTFFAENIDLSAFNNDIEEIIVYKWNRVYPGDFFCNIDFSRFNIESVAEFPGNSHEKITKIIYKRLKV